MRGIYLHIPFCIRKCSYCDFYSVPAEDRPAGEFPRLLLQETTLLADRFPGIADTPADTVYFGGGTPTVLGAEVLCGLLSRLRTAFPVVDDAEISTETNPGTVSRSDLYRLREGGFTRVSVGVQSFSPSTLRVLGRIHGVEEILRTVREARAAGFRSVGVDLIFGIPGQSPASWRTDLERTVELSPSHVSAYALAPEPGTPIHRALARGELRMPDDDEVAGFYEEARAILSAAGIAQYEISNFARPGRECRHNRKYWTREEYLGFGPSAHGFLLPREGPPFGLRTANPPSLREYGEAIRAGRLAWSETGAATREDAWRESLIFGLRMTEGVDLREVRDRYGEPPTDLADSVDRLVSEGLLLSEGERIRLPSRFLFVSNGIFARLS
ncbi:MAG: radical SAM family heme chaperone HemW [Deltaproteobacteria bacterium]